MNCHELGVSLGLSQFENKKEKRKRSARLKVDPKNNMKSATHFLARFTLNHNLYFWKQFCFIFRCRSGPLSLYLYSSLFYSFEKFNDYDPTQCISQRLQLPFSDQVNIIVVRWKLIMNLGRIHFTFSYSGCGCPCHPASWYSIVLWNYITLCCIISNTLTTFILYQ